jgi:peptidyl-prolyl cis-trans isomerase A (cyclophilin A)
MLRLAALALLLAAPATGAAPKPATVRVDIKTSDGLIELELEQAKAPISTANFLAYVDQKRLDGTSFYRAVKVGEGYGFVQGGTRNDPRRTLPPVAHEPTTKTGLSHVDGAISLARLAPGTAAGDFVIVVGAIPSMDADPTAKGDNQGFAVFGHVVDGMDVVHQILEAPKATGGAGVMKGQMLVDPVRILTARRAS